LDGWRVAGAEVLPFSPLADQAPDPHADAVYLPGGYPELHAERLAGNHGFIGGLRAAAERGAVVYGECGGFMTLGERLVDRQGESHAMAGLLPIATSFAEPRLHLGYRRIKVLEPSPLGQAGTAFRGHEFHYASVIEPGDAPPLFEITDARRQPLDEAGARSGTVCGSFLHLIDRASEPTDDLARPRHLRLV
jgi:cobyrinic acid a,c-diamide synthase